MNMKLLAILTLTGLLVAACNLTAPPEVILVTATPSVSETPSPVPLTPTPTIPPSPTTDPGVVLQLADNFLLNGRYEQAVGAYEMVLAQGAPLDMNATATYSLGRAALKEGMFDRAVESLTAFINSYPQDSRLPQALFLRGDAYLGLSRWAEAIADFQQYLTLRPGLIDSYAQERIGDAQLALGQVDAALASYDQAVAAARTRIPQVALRDKVARVLESSGQTAAAVAQYDAILAEAQNTAYRASIAFAAAQALVNSGDLENGLERMLGVFTDYPGTAEAYEALNVLQTNGREVDGYAAGRVQYLYGDYAGAVETLNTWSTQRPLSAIPAEFHLLLGRAYRELGNAAAAEVAFQTIIDQYPQDPLFGEALLEQGRTRFLAGDIPAAIERYLFIADTYGYLGETAAEALWRAGYLYGTNDDPTQSRIVFERLADEYPGTEQARSGLFLAASAAYNLGELARAEQLFARIASTTSGDDQSSAYLWVGRLAQQRGDASTAQQAFQLAISAAPDSYFAARAQDLITGQAPFAPPDTYRFQFDDVSEIAAAEAWLRSTYGITQEGDLWPLAPALDTDPRMIRGRELWAVGAYDAAETEFESLLNDYQQDGLASYQLAIYLRGIGAYRASILGAANVIRGAGVGTLDAPPYLARMRYPIYYLDAVQAVAQERGIDPLLMFSLIRLESLFDANATAAAGEKGLTQVIPSTAEYIATQIQWPDYQHSDLFRPYAAVSFGAYYLDEQLERFGGNVPAALAGYNAGPGRAGNWLELSGGDPDLFISAITIESTRGYVQRIYSFYNIYRMLYGTT